MTLEGRKSGGDIRFIADHMLGKLARWLRILGYDTLFSPAFSDSDIARLGLGEGRIVLTRDRGLTERKAVSNYIFVDGQELAGQLRQVFGELGLEPESGKIFSRCPLCNLMVESVEKSDVEGLVPPYVYRTNESFSRCPKCNRIYWTGTHLEKTVGILRKIFGAIK